MEPGCLGYGMDSTRCPVHTKRRDGAKNARRANSGDGAARRARYALNRAGSAICAHCGLTLQASALHVDHARAIADGGADVDTNIQLLCIPCHYKKTRNENARRGGGSGPFR